MSRKDGTPGPNRDGEVAPPLNPRGPGPPPPASQLPGRRPSPAGPRSRGAEDGAGGGRDREGPRPGLDPMDRRRRRAARTARLSLARPTSPPPPPSPCRGPGSPRRNISLRTPYGSRVAPAAPRLPGCPWLSLGGPCAGGGGGGQSVLLQGLDPRTPPCAWVVLLPCLVRPSLPPEVSVSPSGLSPGPCLPVPDSSSQCLHPDGTSFSLRVVPLLYLSSPPLSASSVSDHDPGRESPPHGPSRRTSCVGTRDGNLPPASRVGTSKDRVDGRETG